MNIEKTKNWEILFKFMKKNPDLPIVSMVEGEIVAGDDFGYWLGSWGLAEIDEYLEPKGDYGYIHFKSNNDVFGVLGDYLTNEEFENLPETEDECRDAYNKLPWIKAIIVYITSPY